MKYVSETLLLASDATSQTSMALDSEQLCEISFHVYFGDSTAAGTIQIQASNDPNPMGYLPQAFTPSNWVNIPDAIATVTAGSTELITLDYCTYRWLRLVYTSVTPGTSTITANIFGISI